MRQPGTLPLIPKRSPRGSSKLPLTSRLAALGGGGPDSTGGVEETVPNWQPGLIVTGGVAATGKVVIGNATVSAPAGTITTTGTTAAAGLLLVRFTISPSPPAGRGRITCPIAG